MGGGGWAGGFQQRRRGCRNELMGSCAAARAWEDPVETFLSCVSTRESHRGGKNKRRTVLSELNSSWVSIAQAGR